jgi:hypothetical protein
VYRKVIIMLDTKPRVWHDEDVNSYFERASAVALRGIARRVSLWPKLRREGRNPKNRVSPKRTHRFAMAFVMQLPVQ